jgi:hypothetical protein
MHKYLGYKTLVETIRELAELILMEKSMTDAQLKKREDLVKGMKKDFKDFQKRYGMRAKDVIFGTATNMAMKSEEIENEKQ